VSAKSCTVTFEERGHRHEAKVDASSLYEAGALALKQWQSRRYIKGPSRRTFLEIEVAAPRKFRVRVEDLLAWLYSRPAKTKDEQQLKERLRYLLSEGR
jgi:hypothetical protein